MKTIFFLLSFFLVNVWADSNQGVIPYSLFSNDRVDYNRGHSNGSYFLPRWDGDQREAMRESEESSPFLQYTISDKQQSKPALNFRGNSLLGDFFAEESYYSYTNRDILDEVWGAEKGRLTFTFTRDDFSYINQSDNFEKIYRKHRDDSIRGMVSAAYDFYYFTSFLSGYYGLGLGFGYNNGRGIFINKGQHLDNDLSSIDRANFNLFTIPMDARLGFELGVTHYFSLDFSLGPSFLSIIENRNDRSYESGERNKIQFSPGYFMQGTFRVFLSSLMKGLGVKLYGSDGVNKFSLNFSARMQSYDRFKEDGLSISGQSFGVGFTYDFF